MKLSIRNVKIARGEEWDNVWRACDYSTYFHSREWAEIWQSYKKGRLVPEARIIFFTDGTSALIPCSYERLLHGFFKSYLMSPAGTFGGWLSLDHLTTSHAELLREYIFSSFRNLTWRSNPYNVTSSKLDAGGGEVEQTQSLNLQYGFQAAYKNWSKGHKAAAKQARKSGVVVKQADTLKEWLEYFRVYEDTIDRWGSAATTRYSWQLFEAIYERSSSDTKLWLAIYEDRIIAGALCFYAKVHVVYWHGASLVSYKKLRPVNFLMLEAIEQCCADGYGWFDFNPSGDLEGVRAFKKSFGTEDLPCPMFKVRSKPRKGLQGAVCIDQEDVFVNANPLNECRRPLLC